MNIKNILFAFFLIGLISSCGDSKSGTTSTDGVDPNLISNEMSANDPNAENPEPIIHFDEPVWDFGKIHEGETVKHTFRFTNKGNEALVISKCSASCGCTTPVCENKPIAPGQTGKIKVEFNSENKKHTINKQVTIVANTVPPTTVLTVKGYVVPLGE